MTFLAEFIMRGRMQAIGIALGLIVLSLVMHPLLKPLVFFVSSAAIALVTLRRGALEGAIIFASATAVSALMGFIMMGGMPFFVFMAVYCLTLWLPIWIIAIVLRETRQLALTIETSVFLGILGVMGFYGYSDNPSALWQGLFNPFLTLLPENAPTIEIQERVNFWTHYMTGVAAASMVFSELFGLFLARWWQANLYNPGGFKHEFLTLRIQPRLAIITVSMMALAWLSSGGLSEILWNIVILLFVLYTFIGTSVLHTVFANMQLNRYTVPMFYITLFLIPHVLIPVALIGLSDPWLDLRKEKKAL